MSFAQKLLAWHKDIDRLLPWKEDKDPYKIWLSEIILQQTRVDQGLPYYYKFVRSYPGIVDLANAPIDDILLLWQGLGYYARARNMHATAQIIRDQYKGKFPNNYNDIISLKGVGPYTAAAIASFAFDLPYPVLDGNVQRVLSRYFAIVEPIDTTVGKHILMEKLDAVFDASKSAAFNQAIMDLGALVCKPSSPECHNCNLSDTCLAFQSSEPTAFPIKTKKIKVKTRYLHFFMIFDANNDFIIQQRNNEDIWKGLYQLPLVESDNELMPSTINLIDKLGDILIEHKASTNAFTHKLTHQRLQIFVHIFSSDIQHNPISSFYKVVNRNTWTQFAFPIALFRLLHQNLE